MIDKDRILNRIRSAVFAVDTLSDPSSIIHLPTSDVTATIDESLVVYPGFVDAVIRCTTEDEVMEVLNTYGMFGRHNAWTLSKERRNERR